MPKFGVGAIFRKSPLITSGLWLAIPILTTGDQKQNSPRGKVKSQAASSCTSLFKPESALREINNKAREIGRAHV